MPKVLIVDDEPDNIELLQRRLTRKGYETLGAASGEAGLKLAAAELPNLILMDIKMPGLDGLEATKRLKAEPSTAHIPVIALTAHARPEDRQNALDAGADEYESKPIDLPALLGKMEALMGAP